MIAHYKKALEEHRQRVFSFAHYSLRIREEAEDVTQEVFIKLWQNWEKIDHARLGAWLMRVAHNAVIDAVRRRKPTNEHVDDYAEVELQDDETRPDSGEALDEARRNAMLRRAIGRLADPFRSILIMRDLQGASYAHIQHCLDMSESQVKVYLHRGRRKLREDAELREFFGVAGKPAAMSPGQRA